MQSCRQGRRTRHGRHGHGRAGFLIQPRPNFHIYYSYGSYCASAISINLKARTCGRSPMPNQLPCTLGMATGSDSDPHPRRALSALEIYNFPRHDFSQDTVVSRFFQTSLFSNLKWKSISAVQQIHLCTCAIGYVHTGILWPYHLKIASYGPGRESLQ